VIKVITRGRSLSINGIGITTELLESVFIIITALIIVKNKEQ
jgi:hypothetical protein